MDDGVILCFHRSIFVKTSVCFALIKDSDSASPRRGCSSGNLSVSGISGSQSDAHTTGGSFSLVFLGNLQGFLSTSIQTVQVLTMLPWCTDSAPSTCSTKQNREKKNGFGLLPTQPSCKFQGKLYPRKQSSLLLNILM